MSDDASESAAPSPDAAPPRRRRWPRVLAWTAASLVVALLACLGTAYAYYQSLRSNMVQHDLGTALVEEERPPKIGDDINILFIGSDGREGGNAEYGGRDFVGERSDSLMLAHISPDNGVTVVNFPRDSLVQLPECPAYEGTEGTSGYYGMINAALFHGGPPCAVKTIETLSDIRIDHFVHLNFVGFRDMVDAVGGVEMCIPEPMKDQRSKLDLEAGNQVLSGEDSLAFVRARYEIGDGGDLGRIDRQQMFLGAMASQVTSGDVLTSPTRMTSLLTAVTEHTATDADLTLDTMISIGATLSDVEPSDIAFYTVPWWQAPYDPNRVVWDEEKADQLFRAINSDQAVGDALLETGEPAAPESSPSAEPSPSYPAEPSTEPVQEQPSQPPANAIEGRDATSNPCVNGLGLGTEE
ncbi:LCP family protein [Actinorugispora endophytica]|uniref:LytR family transcriptional attenuator n=1 Tax=Actinorugispora endophytica TaxID=1605990 RepID=A0A4R6UXQ7_9ACTN|nr:LCP family protein [Actinorugispora endophytica]TDQ52211.1 LytR family transcriptional attenuator [Actinorugispora endophytica]